MTPALDRDELAARFAVADYGAAMPTGGRGVVATNAVAMADALLSALSPRAAVAPGKYEPKVGDVVRFGALHPDYVVTRTAPELGGKFNDDCGAWVEWYGGGPRPATYLRPATPAEREAAGLPATPAPGAKRPGWVRFTASVCDPVTPRRVLRWVGDNPVVGSVGGAVGQIDESREHHPIEFGGWEPCDAPTPPAPSREDAYKALLAAADDLAVDAGEPFDSGAWSGSTLVTTRRLSVLRDAIKAARAAATKGGA